MTIFFDRHPGQFVHEVPATECGAPALLLGTPAVGDIIRIPPEIGCGTLRIVAITSAPCPKCRAATTVRHYHLGADLSVAECTGACGFVWYRRHATTDDERR